MKTIIESITVSAALYSIIFILIASIAFGSEITINPPIDSNLISDEIVFEEEDYIDDIPFDTQIIAENYQVDEYLITEFNFTDEAYIDDIPFDTDKVVKNYKMDKTIENHFNFGEEAYVDDIPFNTNKIASAVFFQYYSAK